MMLRRERSQSFVRVLCCQAMKGSQGRTPFPAVLGNSHWTKPDDLVLAAVDLKGCYDRTTAAIQTEARMTPRHPDFAHSTAARGKIAALAGSIGSPSKSPYLDSEMTVYGTATSDQIAVSPIFPPAKQTAGKQTAVNQKAETVGRVPGRHSKPTALASWA